MQGQSQLVGFWHPEHAGGRAAVERAKGSIEPRDARVQRSVAVCQSRSPHVVEMGEDRQVADFGNDRREQAADLRRRRVSDGIGDDGLGREKIYSTR
jgi:hypothetical protein